MLILLARNVRFGILVGWASVELDEAIDFVPFSTASNFPTNGMRRLFSKSGAICE